MLIRMNFYEVTYEPRKIIVWASDTIFLNQEWRPVSCAADATNSIDDCQAAVEDIDYSYAADNGTAKSFALDLSVGDLCDYRSVSVASRYVSSCGKGCLQSCESSRY